mmetsp:Transcript_2550/g.8899  ORF Transcript_2550/g.8899 Transcript_2550/m.8899 type:complete len:269 (-) Transcript_2550:56-862(-)
MGRETYPPVPTTTCGFIFWIKPRAFHKQYAKRNGMSKFFKTFVWAKSGRASATAGMVCRSYPASGTSLASCRPAVPAKWISTIRSFGSLCALDASTSASATATAGNTCPPVPPAAKSTRRAGRAACARVVPTDDASIDSPIEEARAHVSRMRCPPPCRCVRVKSTQTTRGVPRAAHPPDASKHRLKWVTTPLCVERRALPVPFVLRATATKGPETPPCTRVAIITDPPEAKGRPPASPGVTTSTQASSGRTEWMAIADEINGTAGRHC